MSDDKSKTGKADRIRINIHEDHELAYWSRRLDCPREVLISASHVVGPMVKDIAQYLGLSHTELESDRDYLHPDVEVTYVPQSAGGPKTAPHVPPVGKKR